MVRLRITRQPNGYVDGLRLDDLVVGSTYDVGTMLGCYLLAEQLAVPVGDDVPALPAALSTTRFRVIKPTIDGKVVRMRAPQWADRVLSEAADRPPRRRRKKPR